MLERVTLWLVGAMIAWVPTRTPADEARYASIARDLATVVLDPTEEPAFTGEDGRARTALLLASIASWESGYRADVDDGRVKGDHGTSVCLMQVRVFGKTKEGWTAKDLTEDRQKCFRVALRLVRTSFEWCKARVLEDRLAGYTVGTCREAEPLARARFGRARNYWGKHPLPAPAEDGGAP
jgi:hypothetical protein